MGKSIQGVEKWDPPWNFDWSNEKLWALKVPTIEISIQRLSWILSKPVWSTVQGKDLRDLVPDDVIRNPTHYEMHYRRILVSDLRFPIDCVWMSGRYHILDGVHRLAKSTIENHQSITIRKIKTAHFDRIRV
jgi:hypothetical protein